MKTKHPRIPMGIVFAFSLAASPDANETVCTERIDPIFGRSDNCSGQWLIRQAKIRSGLETLAFSPLSYNGTKCVDAGFVTGTRKIKDQLAVGYRFQKWGTSQAVGMRDCECGEIELEEIVHFNTTECVLTEEDCPPNPYE